MPGAGLLFFVLIGAALLLVGYTSVSAAGSGVGDSCYDNSCYIISKDGEAWNKNRQTCKSRGGDLVSIETPEEWEYINSKIQQITLPQANEWHIGLIKEEDWKWVNGKPLTISKWQRRQPSEDGNVAVMSKDYPPGSQGLFNDLDPGHRKPYICEIPERKNTRQPAPPVSPACQLGGNQKCNKKSLDFENANEENCLIRIPCNQNTQRSRSSHIAKHGGYSLEWKSASGLSKLRYQPSSPINQRNGLRYGGIKMWIYKTTKAAGKKMKVKFRGKRKVKGTWNNDAGVGKFSVHLGFKGWRAIWIAYKEFIKQQTNSITTVDFVLDYQDTIYIDLLEFVPSLAFQSRDKIVPPLKKLYDESDFWQQSYRWSKKEPPKLPASIDASMTLGLTHIESRLSNFYCDESKTTYEFTGSIKKRWDALKSSIENANMEYDRLQTKQVNQKAVISGPSLFGRNSKFGTRKYSAKDSTRKFDFVMMKILLPLTIEFYLKSRENEMTKTVEREFKDLNDQDMVKKSIRKIAGELQSRQNEFYNDFKKRTSNNPKQNIRLSLEYVNQKRLERIFNLLDFVEDQGWADGSGLGSLYLDMNRDGAGYMHSLFLLKKTLHKDSKYKNRLLNLVNTAKWYNDFGEIYQTKFEYSGTTADRMITIMLFRLMIVLIMPTDTDDNKKARQRDMDELKKWLNNALSINKAFGGVIKPDYTGFHHQAFYASAYFPNALHTAAQVHYLLDGTVFALSDTAKRNLREGLKTMRNTAVKYSTPSSVGGRFPDYSNGILIKTLPAFAFMSLSHQGKLPPTPVKGITISNLNSEDAKMFLRLYQTSDKNISKYARKGAINKGKTYMNSLGSLQIMNKVHAKATSLKLSAESSPVGHWSKNFAAFSIHRRNDWAVTVKGFNKHVWDFEGSTSKTKPANIHGIFASHGAMLIANSEEALRAHDVKKGWDWTKIPGATTMSLTLQETTLTRRRNFSPLSDAGGVTFQGSNALSNGVFGMDFKQPKYQWENNPNSKIKLLFKKSVFFHENLLVCLGSNIKLEEGPGKKAMTTLFQDKLAKGSSIKIDGVQKAKKDAFKAMTPSNSKSYTTLVDTKGNSYFIPSTITSSLKVHVKDQSSETPSGKTSKGFYGTAWLEHSTSVNKYEYAVYVKAPSSQHTADEAWAYKEGSKPKKLYEVLKQDAEAHVVKFDIDPVSLNQRRPLYGYAIFSATNNIHQDSPISSVSKQCRIMLEDLVEEIHLSISYPDLDFLDLDSRELTTISEIGAHELFKVESKEKEVKLVLKTQVSTTVSTPKVHGSPPGYAPTIKVENSQSSSQTTKGDTIIFSNLKNGFSVEVKLTKSS